MPIDRIELNDILNAYLDAHGWYADTEEDMDRLNDLTHTVATAIDTLLELSYIERMNNTLKDKTGLGDKITFMM